MKSVAGNRNSWEHDDEIMQLYEEMEKHISCEKERLEQKVHVFQRLYRNHALIRNSDTAAERNGWIISSSGSRNC